LRALEINLIKYWLVLLILAPVCISPSFCEEYAITSSTTMDRESISEAAGFVEEVAGPYVIEFDLTNSSTKLNSSETYWDVSDPVLSLGGAYVVLKNDTNYVVASIAILHSARHNGLLYSPIYLESGLIDKGY
jgi:hypothetical protein